MIPVGGGSFGANLGGTIWSKDKGVQGAEEDTEGLKATFRNGGSSDQGSVVALQMSLEHLRRKTMPLKIVWAITGSGDLISEVFEVMNELSQEKDLEITSVLSKAAIKVVNWYKLSDKLNSISKKVLVEEDANTPFIVGPLQTGQFDCLLVAPATANTVAKVVNGIADTIVTNAISQTNKTGVGIYILPVDQKKGRTITILPGGKKLELTMRHIDVENTDKLRNLKGITTLTNPGEIRTVVSGLLNNMVQKCR